MEQAVATADLHFFAWQLGAYLRCSQDRHNNMNACQQPAHFLAFAAAAAAAD